MKTIQELERFFDLDLSLKKLIESSRPNIYNSDIVDIENDLLKVVNTSRRVLNQMVFMTDLDVEEEFNELIEKIEEKIKNCNYDINKLISVYENDILNFSKGLEESLEKNIKGYNVKNGIYVPLRYCNTINDMLHYIHFYVLNDQKTLQSMNIVDKKLNESGVYSILYGNVSEEAKDIFDNLPNSKRENQIDVVSFNNHVIVMVRDVGHALTIDVQKENDNYRVYYFIPKTCNVEMTNNLRGVKKLDPDNYDLNDPTHGEFVVSKNELGKVVGDFIAMVPTDENVLETNPKL